MFPYRLIGWSLSTCFGLLSINESGASGMDIKTTINEIQSHIDRGNYHAGINIAISAVNEGRRTNDQECVDTFLELIKGIVQRMSSEFGSKEYLAGQ